MMPPRSDLIDIEHEVAKQLAKRPEHVAGFLTEQEATIRRSEGNFSYYGIEEPEEDILQYYNKLPTPYVIYSKIGKSLTLDAIQNAYSKSVSIQCSQYNGKQLLSEIYTYWSKKGKMIDRPTEASSNCGANQPIYITSYNES